MSNKLIHAITPIVKNYLLDGAMRVQAPCPREVLDHILSATRAETDIMLRNGRSCYAASILKVCLDGMPEALQSNYGLTMLKQHFVDPSIISEMSRTLCGLWVPGGVGKVHEEVRQSLLYVVMGCLFTGEDGVDMDGATFWLADMVRVTVASISRLLGDVDDEEDSPYNEGDAMLDEYEREERKNPREIPISEPTAKTISKRGLVAGIKKRARANLSVKRRKGKGKENQRPRSSLSTASTLHSRR